jgi:hypothetical protein
MKRTQLNLLLVIAAALCAGCATRPSIVESNRAQDWTGQIRRAYVQVTSMREWGPPFNDAFEKQINQVLSQCGVTSKIVRRNALDLENPEQRTADVRQFGADSVLAIWPTGGGQNVNGTPVNRIFAAQLTVPPARPVWRAHFTVFRGGTAVETLAQRGEAFAIELTNRMKQEGLLAPCPQLPVPKHGIQP